MRKGLVVNAQLKFVPVLHNRKRIFPNAEVKVEGSLVSKNYCKDTKDLRIVLIYDLSAKCDLLLA